MKKCTKCGEQKPLSQFYKSTAHKDGVRNDCKTCNKLKAVYRYRKDPEKHKSKRLQRVYGIDSARLSEMLVKQNYCCAICNIKIKTSKEACVDHDHKTGSVRDILCHHCNRAIGLFKENIKTLQNAVSYLKQHQS